MAPTTHGGRTTHVDGGHCLLCDSMCTMLFYLLAVMLLPLATKGEEVPASGAGRVGRTSLSNSKACPWNSREWASFEDFRRVREVAQGVNICCTSMRTYVRIPRSHVKKRGVAVSNCNPRTGIGMGRRLLLGLAGQPV